MEVEALPDSPFATNRQRSERPFERSFAPPSVDVPLSQAASLPMLSSVVDTSARSPDGDGLSEAVRAAAVQRASRSMRRRLARELERATVRATTPQSPEQRAQDLWGPLEVTRPEQLAQPAVARNRAATAPPLARFAEPTPMAPLPREPLIFDWFEAPIESLTPPVMADRGPTARASAVVLPPAVQLAPTAVAAVAPAEATHRTAAAQDEAALRRFSAEFADLTEFSLPGLTPIHEVRAAPPPMEALGVEVYEPKRMNRKAKGAPTLPVLLDSIPSSIRSAPPEDADAAETRVLRLQAFSAGMGMGAGLAVLILVAMAVGRPQDAMVVIAPPAAVEATAALESTVAPTPLEAVVPPLVEPPEAEPPKAEGGGPATLPVRAVPKPAAKPAAKPAVIATGGGDLRPRRVVPKPLGREVGSVELDLNVAPTVVSSAPKLKGHVDVRDMTVVEFSGRLSQVEDAYGRREAAVQACYASALDRAGRLVGEIELRWLVQAGAVQHLRVMRDTVGDAMLASCIKDELSKAQFPTDTHGPVGMRFAFRVK